MRGAGKNSKITCHAISFGVTSPLYDKKKTKTTQTRAFGELKFQLGKNQHFFFGRSIKKTPYITSINFHNFHL